MNTHLSTATAACLAAGVISLDVRGDVVTAYDDGYEVHYEIVHMPDLDQRRMPCDGVLGLANDGAMHCVPTSALNMCIYAANHGFPEFAPGPGNFQSSSLYGLATLNIAFLGADMGTDPFEGTDGGAFDGLKSWIAESGLAGKLNVHSHFVDWDYVPNADNLASHAVAGRLVSFAYGRYATIGEYAGHPLVDRTGGHAVTLTRADLVAGEGILWFRDPADVPTDCAQDPFLSRAVHVDNVTVSICDNWWQCPFQMSALNHPLDDGQYRIIDSALTITPASGYSWEPGGTFIDVSWPFLIGANTPFGSNQVLDVSGIIDVIIDPDEMGFYVLDIGQSAPRLGRHDAVTGEYEEISLMGSIPSSMTMGPHYELYTLEADKLICFNPRLGEQTASAEPPFAGDLVVWDGDDRIRVLSVSQRMFAGYQVRLPDGQSPALTTLPDIPLGASPAVAFNPVDGQCWIASEASNAVYGLSAGEGGAFETVTVPGVTSPPTCISFNDAGRMFVTAGGDVFEMIDDAVEGWIAAPDPIFGDAGGSSCFKVTCSRTNFDPARHTGPAWNNIDPDALDLEGDPMPDCLADLNGDGVVDTGDILVILGAWGDAVAFEPADIQPLGGDGYVDTADLLALLAAWGRCP